MRHPSRSRTLAVALVLVIMLSGCTTKAMDEPTYVAWVDEKNDAFEAMAGDIGRATQQWQRGELQDAEAAALVKEVQPEVKALLKEMEGIKPPASVETGHRQGITAMKLLVMTLDAFVSCIETSEEHHCVAAGTHHRNAIAHFEAWLDAVDQIR